MVLFSPSVNKYKRKIKKLEKKFDQYVNFVTEGFVYRTANNISEAKKKLKKANSVFRETNLSKLLESKIYYAEKKYNKSESSFKKINNTNLNLDLFNLKIKLEESKRKNDIEEMQNYAEQIRKIEPINHEALEVLFQIYKNIKDWECAEKILQIAIKSKTFNKEKMKDEILFVYTSLGKKYYDSGEFFKAKIALRDAYSINQKYIQSTILLVQTYIALGKRLKAIEVIKKAWKHNSNPKLAELYFSLLNEKDKKSIKSAEALYRLNPKSYESNYILARAYFNNQIYLKARKYAKIAESIAETKEVYELMLKIEQEDKGGLMLINNLKNRISMAKDSVWKCVTCNKEYKNWQPFCNNCQSLDSLKWSE